MFKFKTCLLTVLVLNLSSGLTFASNGDKESVSQAVQQIADEQAVLQQQIISIHNGLNQIHNKQQQLSIRSQQLQRSVGADDTKQVTSIDGNNISIDIPHPVEGVDHQDIPPQSLYDPSDNDLNELENIKDNKQLPYGATMLGNIGGTAVITSPFIHSRFDYGGSSLITNYSSINKDVSALRQRAGFARQMAAMGMSIPGYPVVELSGQVEGQAYAWRQFSSRHVENIDLTTAELDVQALVNKWFTGFMSFTYDNSPPAMGPRVANSNVAIDNAFITMGNFLYSPFYATVGQVYIPFGDFSSYLVSDPLDKLIFRTRNRPLVLGYQSQEDTGFYGAVYGFRGDTREGKTKPGAATRTRSGHINQYGVNGGYVFAHDKFNAEAGASYINNIADSTGLQSGGPSFGGFGTSSATQVLAHNVPGVDVRGQLGYDPFTVIAEYATATKAFSPVDLTYNGRGAKLRAYHVEGVYSFDMFKRPSSLALGYGRAYEALAIGVPKHRAAIAVSSSIWRNTLASLEFRHDRNYGRSDTASGSSGPVFTAPGKISNALTAQFDIYF